MSNPELIPQPFANNGNKNTIQNVRQVGQPEQDATWSEGFPPVTMQPLTSGGLPPNGEDVNGALYTTTQAIVHMQKGGGYYFDVDYATDIEGYSIGAVLRSNDNTKAFISTINGNLNNPNSNMAGWKVFAGDGFIATSATKLQTARRINGVLFDGTTDIQINFDPMDLMPVGKIELWHSNVLPTGNKWMVAGSTFDTALYPELAALFPSGIAGANASDRFLRIMGNSTILTNWQVQEDAMQRIYGEFGSAAQTGIGQSSMFDDMTSPKGVFELGTAKSRWGGNAQAVTAYNVNLDSSRVARTDTETRSKSIVVRHLIIKAKP